jgi:hypothetical protein
VSSHHHQYSIQRPSNVRTKLHFYINLVEIFRSLGEYWYKR